MRVRVLYVLANAERGGAERVTLLMLAHHDPALYEPLALFLNPGSLVADVERMRIPTFVLRKPLHLRNPFQVLSAARECRRIVLSEKVDILHSCMSYSHIISSIACAWTGRPTVLFQHGPVGGWIDRTASLMPVTRILANSRHTLERHGAVSLRHRPISVVNCATDFELKPETALELRRQVNVTYGIDQDAIVLGSIARFDPWKGIDLALVAAAPILRERPEARFLVVGGQYRQFHPEYAGKLRRVVQDAGIGNQVIFTGFQTDVLRLLARMDIVIHSSVAPEPFGLVILEGMAAGKAVIASRAGGPLEIITEGHDGLFHEPGDVKQLEAVIRLLMEDDALRERLGACARDTVARRFRPRAMVERLERHYADILGRNQP